MRRILGNIFIASISIFMMFPFGHAWHILNDKVTTPGYPYPIETILGLGLISMLIILVITSILAVVDSVRTARRLIKAHSQNLGANLNLIFS